MKMHTAVLAMAAALAAARAEAQYGPGSVPMPAIYGASAPVRRPAQARAAQPARPAAYTASRGAAPPQAQRAAPPRLAANQPVAPPARTPLVAQAPAYGAAPYGFGAPAAPLGPVPHGAPVAGGYPEGGCGADGCCGDWLGNGLFLNRRRLWGDFFWKTTGDMSQHMPYFPNAHGYYYFAPYNLIHVQQQQEMTARWGQDPRNTQDNRYFERIYQDQEAIQTQDALQNEAMMVYPLR